MKRFLFLIGVALCLSTIKAGVYNNSGTTAEDSIAIVFKYLDSLGQPVAAAANDSVYIAVNYPGGIEAFRDSMVYNDAKITASAWEDLAGGESYTLRYAVADIDGTPVEGTYKVTVTANDNSLTLNSAFSSEFQLYATNNYSTTLDFLVDSLQAVIDTLQNQDNWVGTEVTALKALDSLADVLDSLESISVALEAARDTLQFLVTATGFSTLSASDNIGINWGDVTNQGTSVGLSGTTVGTVSAATLAAGQFTKIKDTVIAFLNNFDPATDSVLSANIEELIDFIWDEILATHTDAGSVGDVLLDTLDAKVSDAGGVASIADADMASIIDTLFQRLVSDTVTSTYLSLLIQSVEQMRDSLQFLISADVSALALEATVSTAQDSLNILTGLTREMQADVDSLPMFDGYCADCRSLMVPAADFDIMEIYKGATRLLRFKYWHIGGATGDDPDSTTVLDN